MVSFHMTAELTMFNVFLLVVQLNASIRTLHSRVMREDTLTGTFAPEANIVDSRSLLDCTRKCLESPECISIHFLQNGAICRLNAGAINSGNDVIDFENVAFFNVRETTSCSGASCFQAIDNTDEASTTIASPTTEAVTAAPPTTEATTTASPSTEVITAEPSTTDPTTSEPSTTEAVTTEPSTTETVTTEPSTTETVTTEPSTTETVTTEPSTTETVTTEPSTTETVTTEPSTTDTITTEPSTTEAFATEPSTNDAMTTDPSTTDATTEPSTSEETTTATGTTETPAAATTMMSPVCATLQHSGKYACLHMEALPWNGAHDVCSADGGKVLIISSKSDHVGLVGFANGIGNSLIFFNAFRLAATNNWYTSDQTPVTWTAWDPNYPQFSSDAQCAALSAADGFFWVHVPCQSPNIFVCEL